MRRLLVLLLLLGCDDGGSEAPADAAPTADVSPGSEVDGDAMLDAEATPDAASVDASVDASSSVDAALECPPGEGLETLRWRYWADEPAPTAGFEAEGIDGVESDADWLEVGVGGGAVSVRATQTTGGRHTGRVDLKAGACVLATLEVRVEVFGAGPQRKVLVVGADGVRSDAMAFTETPVLDRLAQAGYRSFDASTQLTAPTVSGPGWASIFTGVEPEKHRVFGNDDLGQLDRRFRSFLHVARNDLGLRVALAAQWAPIITAIVEIEAHDWSQLGVQAFVTAAMATQLAEEDFDLHFIHMDDVDHAGHASGFSLENPEYREAIRSVDEDVGELLDAILSRPTIADEDWLVIFTTDHGGRGTGHGPQDAEHHRIPLQITGVGLRPELGRGQPSHMDTFPTALAWFGQPTLPAWRIDGHARALDFESICDDAVDEDGDGRVDCADPDCAPACDLFCPDADGPLEGPIEVDTREADNGGGGSCGGAAGPERAFDFVAPADDVYAFHTIGADFDTTLYVLDDCVELACNDHIYGTWRMDVPIGAESGVWLQLAAEQEVRVVVDGADSGTAPLAIHRRSEACAGEDLGAELGLVAEGQNTEAPTRLQLPCAGAGRDTVYAWTAPEAGDYVFDTFGSDFDTVLGVLDPTCADTLACSDDEGGFQSRVQVALEAEQEVRLVVAGFRGRDGAFRLNVSRP